MKKWSLLPAAFCALCLIFDSRCAAEGASKGLELCLRTVIPGVFPLLVLAEILLPNLGNLPVPARFCRFLGIPAGSGGMFGLGLLGGFPVGARCMAQAVEDSRLSRSDAEAMLGLCCQCGPAFLFGVLPAVFGRPELPLLCFCIQLESAALVAHLRPACRGICSPAPGTEPSGTAAVSGAMRTMGTVCAWILLASVFGGFLKKYLLRFLPDRTSLVCGSVLELANGCLSLAGIADPRLRLLLVMGLVSFGGISVHLQIRAIAAEAGLSSARCLQQKLLQSSLSMAITVGMLRFGPVFLSLPLPVGWICKKVWKNLRGCGIISPIREGYNHAVS